jgi:hypothetical protein
VRTGERSGQIKDNDAIQWTGHCPILEIIRWPPIGSGCQSDGPDVSEWIMREIPLLAQTTLPHRADLVRRTAGGFVAVSRNGRVSVLDERLSCLRQAQLGDGVRDISLDADGRAAWLARQRLWIGALDEAAAVSLPTPELAALRWRETDALLWTAGSTGETIQAALRDASGAALRELEFDDPYGDSVVSFIEHPDPRCIVLWLAAGQDGQRSVLLTDSGQALSVTALGTEDYLPPVFEANGGWFVATDEEELLLTSWPGAVELGRLSWVTEEPVDAGSDPDPAGADVRILPGGYASWSSTNGRLHTVDLTTMQFTDEFVLAGHPIVTIAQLYPRLAEDHGPATDFDQSLAGPDGAVLTVHSGATLALSELADWSPDPGRRVQFD